MMEFNEQKEIEQLDAIGKTIGYGRAMQILCQLWDDTLQIKYDIPPFHEKNWCTNERKYMEEVEKLIKASPKVELLGYTMQHHIHRLSLQGSVALSVEKVQRSAFNIPLYIMKTRIKITEANFDQLTPEQLRDGEI